MSRRLRTTVRRRHRAYRPLPRYGYAPPPDYGRRSRGYGPPPQQQPMARPRRSPTAPPPVVAYDDDEEDFAPPPRIYRGPPVYAQRDHYRHCWWEFGERRCGPRRGW